MANQDVWPLQARANAALIASAPDLLALNAELIDACQTLVKWMDSGLTPAELDHSLLTDGARKARAGLARAKGAQ